MKEDVRRLLFTNCTVWTGDVGSAAAREVLVEGSRITSVAPVVAADRRQDAVVVDCGGATLMPGLVDGHSHLSFLEKADIVETGFVPVEEHTLQTMHNARRVLLGGFTSCVGGEFGQTAPRHRHPRPGENRTGRRHRSHCAETTESCRPAYRRDRR